MFPLASLLTFCRLLSVCVCVCVCLRISQRVSVIVCGCVGVSAHRSTRGDVLLDGLWIRHSRVVCLFRNTVIFDHFQYIYIYIHIYRRTYKAHTHAHMHTQQM